MKKKQVILITGASSGIGKDTAIRLAKEGHKVYGAARRVDQMSEIESEGGVALKMDVTDPKQVEKAIDLILKNEERIDTLINNAGYGLYGAVEDISIEDAKRQFGVNIFGLAQITKAVLPHMRKENSGRIINISSMGGKMYTPMGAWYHATKHALEGWSDCLRLELKQFNIDVVIIEPGVIGTEFANVLYEPMLKNSGTGPYSSIANQVATTTKEMYEKPKASTPPSVISKEISKAVNAKKPKTRYRKGKYAKPMVWIRLFMGDRFFDKVVMSQIK